MRNKARIEKLETQVEMIQEALRKMVEVVEAQERINHINDKTIDGVVKLVNAVVDEVEALKKNA